MQIFLTATRRAILVLAMLGVAAYGAAALVTVADVLGRRVGLPIDGVVDLVQLFVVTGAWLVMPWAFCSGAHVGVDFLITRLPRAPQILLRFLAMLAALALLGAMLWLGYGTFQQRVMFGDRSQQLGIPISWFWLPLLIGLGFSLLGAIAAFLSPQVQGQEL
ncbi:TRAP transporter small permease [Sulfitobacter aestuarii]|uniref:TRAP transporter small permease protein n=1 Tax=Sulfitobacter aestuarii TaxID=2161676 RepID=A0ABW5U314_9RHOB